MSTIGQVRQGDLQVWHRLLTQIRQPVAQQAWEKIDRPVEDQVWSQVEWPVERQISRLVEQQVELQTQL